MPVFEITDPQTGKVLELEGESPPTEEELNEIFSNIGGSIGPKMADDPTSGELGILKNSDGSHSTEVSITIEKDGRFFNIPTMVKGQINPEKIANGEPINAEQERIAFERFAERGGFKSDKGFDSLDLAIQAAKLRSEAGGSTGKFSSLPANQETSGLAGKIDSGLMTVLEPAATIGSSAIAEPLAGLFGLFDAAINGDKSATKRIEEVRKTLTFNPKTEAGKQGLKSFAEFPPIKLLGEAIQGSEKFLGDAGFEIAGPKGGAFGASIPTAVLEFLGLSSLKKLRLGKGKFIDEVGNPTPELKQALEKAGTKFEDLSKEAIDDLSGKKVQAGAEEIARKERFERQGIPATKGDISQDFKQVAEEQRLQSMVSSESGVPLRELKLQQSEAFKGKVNEIVDSLGGAIDSGEILKEALDGRLKLLKKEKSALYKEFAETSPDIANLPIIPDSVIDAIPEKKIIKRIERLNPSGANALDDLLIEFGLGSDSKKIKAFTDSGGEITPLTIGNFDDFRQGINIIERSDQTNAIKNLTGPIKRALDEEAGLVDDAIKFSGISDESALKPLQEARKTIRTIKTEFSPESITGKLTGVKKDGVTPVIEASQAIKKVLGDNIPIENLERTLESLGKAGNKGRQAVDAMQASVILKALDDALKSPSRKTAGIETIGGNQFAKSLEKFGDKKLDLLFKDKPELLKQLRELKQIAKDMSPEFAAVPKGSAPIILDIAKRASRLPIAAAAWDAIRFITTAGADDRAIRNAIKAQPNLRKTIRFIESEYPSLAVTLGITGIIETIDGKEKGAN